jgi:hypothetical protein
MISLQSGVLDKTRLFSNILMILLVAGNIFFSIQYTENIKQQNALAETDNTSLRVQSSRFLKLFIDIVLNSSGEAITYTDRVALENAVRQTQDDDIVKQWNAFVESTNEKTAQENSVKLMKLVTTKMLVD